MHKAVEVFVTFRHRPVVADHSSFASDHAACKGVVYKEESYAKYKTAKVLAEGCQDIMDAATEKAQELHVKLRVYDLTTVKGRLVAKLRGVDSPTWRIRD